MPPAASSIRLATVADAESVAAIAAETYREHFAHIWGQAGLAEYVAREFDARTIFAELGSATCRYLLAERDGIAIGFAKVRLSRPLPTDATQVGVELQKIYLRKTDVGGGVGAQLLGAVIAEGRAAGFALLWLDVLVSNVGGQQFYRRHGFSVVGEIPFATDLGPAPLLVMARPI